jgi:hypothetical protein
MLIQACTDHLFHNVIGHQLAGVHDALDARGQLGMALDVPAENVADRDVNEVIGLAEQRSLGAFARSVRAHDDIFVHNFVCVLGDL